MTSKDEDDSPAPSDKRKVDEAADLKTEETPQEPAPKKRKASSSVEDTVKWLLSDDAFSLAFPALPSGHGEVDWDDTSQHQRTPPPDDAGKNAEIQDEKEESDAEESAKSLLTYPNSPLTPFQNLVAALLLSKPISHRLGLRTINTLLNPPFGLRTPQDLAEAGFQGRGKVMWEARTQHKEKTAAQLGELVCGVREICGGDEDVEQMDGLRERIKNPESVKEAQKRLEKILTDGIKGIGPTGAGIFMRRVQGRWDEVFPYADQRALDAAVRFGLIEEGDAARELAAKVDGDRGQFVRLLDVLVGIHLEKMDEALRKAGVTD
ncbi:hypothetical protein CPLU01_14167 [Colletotrichum plurivorum]|uniref:Uncharacterized protein n=1 Tax=Colletotrichum plurivorum TaxID=2175906 RepID=A0A8H6JLD0_9PEZI|nr:hypothetical protein CPLU01_14167 [Colletotrichum plurivorum]